MEDIMQGYTERAMDSNYEDRKPAWGHLTMTLIVLLPNGNKLAFGIRDWDSIEKTMAMMTNRYGECGFIVRGA